MAKRKTPQLPDWARLHLWQIQPLRDVLVGFAVFGLFLLGARISIVTVPLLLAILFAYLFEPVVKKMLEIPRMTRKLAAIVLVVAGVVLLVVPLVVATTVGVLQGVQLVAKVGVNATKVVASLASPEDDSLRGALGDGAWLEIRDFLHSLGTDDVAAEGEAENVESLSERYLGVDPKLLQDVAKRAVQWVGDNFTLISKSALSTGKGAVGIAVSAIGSVGSLVFGAFLTAFFFFFLSSSWGSFKSFSLHQIPDDNRDRVIDILGKMDVAISGFVRGRLTIAFILANFYTIGFWLIGVPAPLVLGPVIAVLSIIPYAALLGLPVVIVLVWLEPHTGLRGSIWWAFLAPVVIYQIGQAADDYLLTPKIQGDATGLDTPTILFASIAGGSLLGFYGLLVAIPLAACIKILVVEVFVPRYQAWLKGEKQDFLPLDRD